MIKSRLRLHSSVFSGGGSQSGVGGGAGGRKWSPRPPDVERGDMSVSYIFLAGGFLADFFDGEGFFNKAFHFSTPVGSFRFLSELYLGS